MAGEKPKQVFVSYSDKNRDFAQRLIDNLRGSGITANSGLDSEISKVPGLHRNSLIWMDALRRAIKDADAYVVLVGPEIGEWQRREWQLALEETWEHPAKQFIPVLLDHANPPPFLSEYQSVIVDDSEEGDAAQSVLRSLRHGNPAAVSYKASDEWKKRLDYIGKVAVGIKKFNA